MADWTPRDFVTRGLYCDLDAVRVRLSDLRIASGARSATLFAYDGDKIFRSLVMIVHADRELAGQIESALVAVGRPLLTPDRSVLEGAAADDCPADPSLLAPDASPLREFLMPLGWQHPYCVIEPATRLSVTVGSAPALACGVVLGFDAPPASVRGFENLLEDLHLRVNATAEADVYRQYRRTDSIDADLSSDNVPQPLAPSTKGFGSDAVPSTSPYHYFSQGILDAAVRLTRSSVGNIYLSTSRHRHLVLAAHHNNAKLVPSIKRDSKESVVAWVYRRNLPLLINDIPDFERRHPDSRFINVHDDRRIPYAELAVPIRLRHPNSARTAVLGVINVERSFDIDEGPYTTNDLAVVQQLAERFCLLRSEALLNLAGSSLGELTRRTQGHGPYEWRADRARYKTLSSGPRFFLDIPIDFRRTRPTLSHSLEQVWTLTRSSSVTIRLLSSDGTRLVRFCAVPSERMHDIAPTIELDDVGSVNAWVGRAGKACHLRDLADGPTSQTDLEAHEGLKAAMIVRGFHPRSELCFPLFVDGRLVGTMNLESTIPHAYAETFQVAEAIAELVALQLASARRRIRDQVFSLSAATTANTHEIMKAAGGLLARAKHQVSLSSGDVQQSAKLIMASVSAMRNPTSDRRRTLAQIIHGAIVRNKLDEYADIDGSLPNAEELSPWATLSLQVAFGELLQNAAFGAFGLSNWRLAISCSERSLGGREYWRISLGHSVLEPFEPSWLDSLYRRPLVKRGEERVHIGAYVVGALVRSMGGDVYAVQSHGHFQTVVEIPREPVLAAE